MKFVGADLHKKSISLCVVVVVERKVQVGCINPIPVSSVKQKNVNRRFGKNSVRCR
jgi:hypothetical protein